MRLTKQELLALKEKVIQLDEEVGLDEDTLLDINKAIDRELNQIQDQQNVTDHFDNLGYGGSQCMIYI